MTREQRYNKAFRLYLVATFFAVITLIFTQIEFGRTLVNQKINIIAIIFSTLIYYFFYLKKNNVLRIILIVMMVISIPPSIMALLRMANVSVALFELGLLQFVFSLISIFYILRR